MKRMYEDAVTNRIYYKGVEDGKQQQAEQIITMSADIKSFHGIQADLESMNRKFADLRVNRGEKDDEIKRLEELLVKLHKVGFGNLYNVEKNRILELAAQPQGGNSDEV